MEQAIGTGIILLPIACSLLSLPTTTLIQQSLTYVSDIDLSVIKKNIKLKLLPLKTLIWECHKGDSIYQQF